MTANSVSGLEDTLVTETYGKFLGGSDHSAVFFKLKIKPGTTNAETQEEKPIIGPT